MPFLRWSEEYSVGIALFDGEHRRLFDMANALYDAVLNGSANEDLQSIYHGLVSFTYRHFSHEEDFFSAAGYPGAEEHKAQHDALRTTVQELQERIATTPKDILALEMARLIKDWINNHILVHDLQYGMFLHQKGVR